MEKTKLTVTVDNHFDLMWRRCADRPLLYEGKSFVPYADLEAYYIEDNLSYCREFPDYAFQVESVAVLRKFMRNHPEHTEEIKSLATAGRLFVPFSGDNIIDTNMTGAESIIRNYLYGGEWLRKNLGLAPKLCDRADAFGNSAQLPQILRRFGVRWVTSLHYSTPGKNVYWRGLDGSVVCCLGAESIQGWGGWGKYKPCPVCGGFKKAPSGADCPVCGGRGIDLDDMKGKVPDGFELRRDKLHTDGYPNLIQVGSEEVLPPRCVPEWMAAHSDEFDVTFTDTEHAMWDVAAPLLAKLDDPDPELTLTGELNPNNTGVYTTRIRAKQRLRHLEGRMAAAELLSLGSAARGAAYPYGELAGVWEIMHYGMFHDAITGTHVDAAYTELMENDDRAEAALDALTDRAAAALRTEEDGVCTVVNASCGELHTAVNGHPVTVAPFAAETVPAAEPEEATEIAPDAEGHYVIENERYRVTADERGLLEIFDRVLNRVVSAPQTYRPGELVMEHDEGSPWSTLSEDHRRNDLGRNTQLTGTGRTKDAQFLTFRTQGGIHCGYATEPLFADVTVTLTRTCPRVDFRMHTTWETFNQRLRVAFPTPVTGRHLYGIPGGVMERPEYPHQVYNSHNDSTWASSCGEWPALHFAGIGQETGSVALFNRGNPSNRIEKGETGETLFLTLLRSPYVPTYLHEPTNYVMTDWNGMLDHGEHVFEYAFVSYAGELLDSDCVRDAAAFNAVPFVTPGRLTLPEMPAVSAAAQVLGLKAAEDGRGLILHLAEQHGKTAQVTVTLPARFTGAECCLLDESTGEALIPESGCVQLSLKPFEITALRLF